jgi:hypothetical protein
MRFEGHFDWSQTLEARNFPRLPTARIFKFFLTANFAKKMYRVLKWKKSFSKEENPFHRLKIHFKRCFPSQNKARRNIKRQDKFNSTFYKYYFQLFYNIIGVQ